MNRCPFLKALNLTVNPFLFCPSNGRKLPMNPFSRTPTFSSLTSPDSNFAFTNTLGSFFRLSMLSGERVILYAGTSSPSKSFEASSVCLRGLRNAPEGMSLAGASIGFPLAKGCRASSIDLRLASSVVARLAKAANSFARTRSYSANSVVIWVNSFTVNASSWRSMLPRLDRLERNEKPPSRPRLRSPSSSTRMAGGRAFSGRRRAKKLRYRSRSLSRCSCILVVSG